MLYISLAGMHGLDVLKWLTDVPALVKVPVLLLVEHTLAHDTVEECIFWGARRILQKDLTSLADVVAIVRELVKSSPHVPASTTP